MQQPLVHFFLEKKMSITMNVGQLPRNYYWFENNAQGGKEVHFSNKERYYFKKDEETEHLFFGAQVHGTLQNKINELNALPKQQIDEDKAEIGIEFVILDANKKKQFIGTITDEQIVQQSKEFAEIESTIKFFKSHIHGAFDEKMPLQLKENNENYELVMRMQSLVEGKKKVNYELKINLQQTQKDIEKAIQTLETQIIVEQVKQMLPGNQFCEKVYLDNFVKHNQFNYIYLSQIIKKSAELEFIILDEETSFSVGILQGNDVENLDQKIKAYQIQFPSGQLIRGQGQIIPFLSRQLVRNDLISLKVITEQQLFYISINGMAVPPIKLSKFFEYSFIIVYDNELSGIISQDENDFLN